MEINDQPFVPPTCPQSEDPEGTFLDSAGFGVVIRGFPGLADTPAPTGTFVYQPDKQLSIQGTFRPVVPQPRVQHQLQTGTVVAENYTQLEDKLFDMRDPQGSAQRVVELGRRLCDRVRVCHGVESDGQCWALGARAVEQAINELDS